VVTELPSDCDYNRLALINKDKRFKNQKYSKRKDILLRLLKRCFEKISKKIRGK
jgi:hypothetical protein